MLALELHNHVHCSLSMMEASGDLSVACFADVVLMLSFEKGSHWTGVVAKAQCDLIVGTGGWFNLLGSG